MCLFLDVCECFIVIERKGQRRKSHATSIVAVIFGFGRSDVRRLAALLKGPGGGLCGTAVRARHNSARSLAPVL